MTSPTQIKMEKCRILFPQLFLFIALVSSCSAFSNTKQDVYLFEPTVTTLKGVLNSKVFPGPPNYESIKKGDKKEKAWLLILPRPITVFYDAKDGDPTSINETESNVRKIQLVTGKERIFKLFRRSLGKEVSCTGTLFHEHTGHHHTRILMDLTLCKILEQ